MQDKDWADVSRIYREGVDSNIATFQTTCPSWNEWNEAHIKKCRLVAEEDGTVVGWAALSATSKRPVYAGVAEVSIYIDKAKQKMGVGTRLLQTLCSEAEKEGFWTLQSGIMSNNVASIKLHENWDFVW